MITFDTYCRVLRVSAVVMVCTLLFQSGPRTGVLFDSATGYLAANVGMSVGVAPNELNTITAELTKQRTVLAQREELIQEREIELGLNSSARADSSGGGDRVTYVLAAILFVQLVLIVLNYALDYLRTRKDSIKESSANQIPVGS